MDRRGWVLLATCSALWGLPYLLIKVAMDAGTSPAVMAFGRTALGALVLLPFALRRGVLRGLPWRAVVVVAALDFTLPFILLGIGERHVDSALAGILIATVPMLIAVLAIWFDHSERATGTRLVGLLLGFLGVCLLLGVEVAGDATEAAAAGLILLASLSYAAASLYLKHAFADVDPLGTVTACLGVAALLAAPFALLAPHAGDGDGIAAVVALGLLCSAAAYFVYYLLIQSVGAGRASLNTYISPVFAVALGVLVGGEPLSGAAIAGLLIILLGSWLGAGGEGNRTEPVLPSPCPAPDSSPRPRP